MKASVNNSSRRPSKGGMCVLLMSALLMAGVTGQTTAPSMMPTMATDPPSPAPVTDAPSTAPVTVTVTAAPITAAPSGSPSDAPSGSPSDAPSGSPVTAAPSGSPSDAPSGLPSDAPSGSPVTAAPSGSPSDAPSGLPSDAPSGIPTEGEGTSTLLPTTSSPSAIPSASPTVSGATATGPPTGMPTSSPSFFPSLSAAPSEAEIVPTTNAPSVSPTASPTTQTPSAPPTETTTGTTTTAPSSGPTRALVQKSVNGLKMTLNGISELPSSAFGDFKSSMEVYFPTYANLATESGVEGSSFGTVVTVQSALPDAPKQLRRQLQLSVTVTYQQDFEYIPTRDDVTVSSLATDPFANQNGRDAFLELLQEANAAVFGDVTSTSQVALPELPDAATQAPKDDDDDDVLSTGAIIGIAVGGAVALAIIIYAVMVGTNSSSDKGGDYQASTAENPPAVLKVSVAGDEVSTLDGPAGNTAPASGASLTEYGDQSVATVDYDYSKAYGGGGDTSVSSAGGTFGSNTQGFSALDPANAAATGATLGGAGSFSDTDSFEAHYRDPNANVKEELIEIMAPPGKLGVVIDTPDDGAPVVHAVKDSSVMASKIRVGDKLVAVDDEDVRSMTAIKVSKLISRKSANPTRKLSLIRTTVLA